VRQRWGKDSCGSVGEYATPIVGGAYISAANHILSQGFANGFKNIDVSQTVFSGITGGLTAQAGQYIGKFVGPEIGKFTSTLTKSPVIQQALTQTMPFQVLLLEQDFHLTNR